MRRCVVRLGVVLLSSLLGASASWAEKEVFGWNATAHTNTTYINDPYWLALDYYSPVWFDIVDQGDTLFNLHSPFTPDAMRAFADAAEAEWPTKKVVPCVQYFTNPDDTTQLNSLLKRPVQRTRIIDQIQAVVDTLHFDGINIDFEYPSDSTSEEFSAFMAELKDSVAGHVSCAVAPVRHSYSDGFDYGVLSDGAHGDLLLEMVYDRFPIESEDPDEHQSGPTTPLWWWKDNADLTHTNYPTGLSRFAMAGPTFGLDYYVTATGNASRRPRAIESGNTKPYFDGLGAAISLSQATHDNNADNCPIQWSVARGWPLSYGGDSTMYIPYTQGATNRQLWWTGAEDWGRFLRKLDGVGIEHAGVWCATTNSDSLIWQTLARWKAGQSLTVPLQIDSLWADNDTSTATNGAVDHPWTMGADTVYLKQHVLAADTTVTQARASVLSDQQWDSMRFRYKLTRAGNVRLAIFRNVDSLWTVGAADADTARSANPSVDRRPESV